MSKTVKTKNGTELPLTNLKGKDYLMVVYRLQWLNEDYENFEINTDFPLLNADETVARATVVLRDNAGNVVKKATATKREHKKDFNDHTEKAETAAIGRALAMLGFGTAQAVADMDEGDRIVDSPLKATEASTPKTTPAAVAKAAPVESGAEPLINKFAEVAQAASQQATTSPAKRGRPTFRKPAAVAQQGTEATNSDSGGWD